MQQVDLNQAHTVWILTPRQSLNASMVCLLGDHKQRFLASHWRCIIWVYFLYDICSPHAPAKVFHFISLLFGSRHLLDQ